MNSQDPIKQLARSPGKRNVNATSANLAASWMGIMMPVESRYPSKVDLWILGWLAVVVVGSIGILFAIPPAANSVQVVMFWVIPFVWLVSFPFMWPVHYTITGDKLVIRVGAVRRSIPLATILEVGPPSGIAPALAVGVKAAYSVDRLIVVTEGSGLSSRIAISPANKPAFLKDLNSRDPGLVFDGASLRRNPTS